MNKTLTFITGNEAKAAQLKKYLNFPIQHQKIDLPEIQSLILSEVVEEKVKKAYQQIKQPVLVEDTALIFKALGQLPGTFIKWFLKEIDNEGLVKLLDNFASRDAMAQVAYGFYDGSIYKFFPASIEGSIATAPRGETHFGWDPIFIPSGDTRTWAQIPEEERAQTSIRKIALKDLESFLEGYFPNGQF